MNQACAYGSLTSFMQESFPNTGERHGILLERHMGMASPQEPVASGIGWRTDAWSRLVLAEGIVAAHH